jgi:hypothetical protein
MGCDIQIPERLPRRFFDNNIQTIDRRSVLRMLVNFVVRMCVVIDTIVIPILLLGKMLNKPSHACSRCSSTGGSASRPYVAKALTSCNTPDYSVKLRIGLPSRYTH